MKLSDLLLAIGVPDELASRSLYLAIIQLGEIKVFLDHNPDRERLALRVALGHWEGDPETLEKMALGNFRQVLTKGATLGLHGETGEIYLTREHTTRGVAISRIATMLEAFLEAADFWKDHFGNHRPTLPADPDIPIVTIFMQTKQGHFRA